MAKRLSPETRQLLHDELASAIRDLGESADLVLRRIEPIVVSIDDNAEARGRALERGEKVAP